MVVPMSDGVGATFTPALVRASILASAVPLPPLMTAPAWPMRLPGGAVVPAMKPATGLVKFSAIHFLMSGWYLELQCAQ